MSIEQWQSEIEEIQNIYSSIKSQTARSVLADANRTLKKKIEDEHKRIEFEKNQEDGIPESFKRMGVYNQKYIRDGNVIYAIDDSGELDKDGSYHWHHHVWIPQTKIKFANLCVRTLGKDVYGDRYYLEVDYYKHPADPFPYMTKRIDPFNRTYLPYVHYVLDSLGLKKEEYKQRTRMI